MRTRNFDREPLIRIIIDKPKCVLTIHADEGTRKDVALHDLFENAHQI